MESAWSLYRVLDLSEEAPICGKVFADLGADVIKVERPGGDPSRWRGPFYKDVVDPEKSLNWFAFNTGKRSITLDITTNDGKAILKRLAKTAHFLVESFPAGHMDSLGLGYSALGGANPALIMAAITPFGQTGPYASYKGTDLICMGMGGLMYVSGEPEQAPLRMGVPEAYLHAGVEAVVGMMMAHMHRVRSGEGQYVDVSAQECIVWETFHTQQFWDVLKINLKRQGKWRQFGLNAMRWLYPCKDGYISIYVLGGPMRAKAQRALVEWMDSEGMAEEWLKEFDWENFNTMLVPQEVNDRLADAVGRFVQGKTKAELFEKALKNGFFLVPINTPEDVFHFPQLAARDFWLKLEHEEVGDVITYPGAPYKSTETPYRVSRRAPLIGEHNAEVYEGELGLSKEDLIALKGSGII
ncbi:MAG: CoA transferase [Chloroflexi bacterium]|nr:CoA transferase [Chloroflexota bacterium]